MLIVSACLVGVCCRYDGKGFCHPRLAKLVEEGKAFALCPEQLGGLPTPRTPCEIKGGDGRDVLAGAARVVDVLGNDQTEGYLRGARRALELCQRFGADKAVLKSRSPSCGRGFIYDGNFNSTLKEGCGVTAALLEENGIQVFCEEDEYER